MTAQQTTRGWFDRLMGFFSTRAIAEATRGPFEIADGLYEISGYLAVARGIAVPTRSFLVKVGEKQWVWISPYPLSGRGKLEHFGEVVALIAPNSFHYQYLAMALEWFPRAKIYLAPGLASRRPEIPTGEELGDQPPPLWANFLEHVVVRSAPQLSEVVFFHRPSASLILTDLAFHICSARNSLEKAIWRCSGEWQHFGPSRTARNILLRDRLAVGKAADKILEWNFSRVLLAHGEHVENQAKQQFRSAFAAWL